MGKYNNLQKLANSYKKVIFGQGYGQKTTVSTIETALREADMYGAEQDGARQALYNALTEVYESGALGSTPDQAASHKFSFGIYIPKNLSSVEYTQLTDSAKDKNAQLAMQEALKKHLAPAQLKVAKQWVSRNKTQHNFDLNNKSYINNFGIQG